MNSLNFKDEEGGIKIVSPDWPHICNKLDSVYVDSKVVVFYPDFPQEYGPEQMEGVDPKFGVRILKVVGDVS